jgi:threonyl-tRNA synthetase
MLVVGEKEQTAESVAVRDRVDGDLGSFTIPELVKILEAEAKEKTVRRAEKA